MSRLKNVGKDPVYKKLKDTIIKEIKNKTLKEGDIILSERLLGEKFNISRISVRKAISELIEENYLYTIPGKGTFVKGILADKPRAKEKTYNLGYIFWGSSEEIIKNPYFAHFIQGAEKEAVKYNYHLLISSMKEVYEGGKVVIPSLITQNKVDGVLIEGVDLNSYYDLARIIPCVIISNYLKNTNQEESLEDIDIVIANDQNACISVLKYLKNLGHQKIGFIYETLNHSSFNNRYNGFITGIEKLGLKIKKEWIVGEDNPHNCVNKIMNLKDRPTAIIGGNDIFALEVLEWCMKNKVSVPEEMSVIGFDDIERCVWSKPPLTTVRVLTDEMGRLATKRLIEKIEDPSIAPTHTLVGTNLIIRESCGPANSEN